MNKLKLHNTLGNKLEEFIPIDKDNVRIYACGPTVYNYAHIGNARMAVVNDLLVRFLRTIYPKVTYVSNITDIDDKIIAASEEKNIPIKELTTKFTNILNLNYRLKKCLNMEFLEVLILAIRLMNFQNLGLKKLN